MKNKITLKSLKVHERLSEETLCFTADVYVDGIFVGEASNRGHGGMTDINLYGHGDRAKYEEADAYFSAQPDNFEGLAGEVDILANRMHEDKKMERAFQRNICFGIKGAGQYSAVGYKGTTLAKMSATPQGKVQLQGLIDRTKAKLQAGETIFNTNLESLGLSI